MERYVAQLVVRMFSICKDFPEIATVGCKDIFHL